MADKKVYLQLQGVKGDSKGPDHLGWIDVDYQVGGDRQVAGGRQRQVRVYCYCRRGVQSTRMESLWRTGGRIPGGILELTKEGSGSSLVLARARMTDIEVLTFKRAFEFGIWFEGYHLFCDEVVFEGGNDLLAKQVVRPTLGHLMVEAWNRL